MSTGTNKERLTQNNEIINENNTDLNALKTKINNLPTSGDTTATASDIALGKTAVSKGVKITGTLENNANFITTPVELFDAEAGANYGKITPFIKELPSLNFAQVEGTTGYFKTFVRAFEFCYNLEKIGDILGTSTITSVQKMFSKCYKLEKAPYFDTSNVTNMVAMFSKCSSLKDVPVYNTSNVTGMSEMFSGCTNLTTIPLLDTSNVTNMRSMFSGCTNLTTIPLLDTSNVKNMTGMFSNCSSLSNDSLNNILAMCANTTSAYTGTKTLAQLSLSQTQAETCQTLSNWDAFVAAGWTTGY